VYDYLNAGNPYYFIPVLIFPLLYAKITSNEDMFGKRLAKRRMGHQSIQNRTTDAENFASAPSW
jgi:hypothetical protein